MKVDAIGEAADDTVLKVQGGAGIKLNPAYSGARAVALVCSYVLEAGLPSDILEAEVRAMAAAAQRAGVIIAGGDTKIVEHGKADQMYITTAGIGSLIPGLQLSAASVRLSIDESTVADCEAKAREAASIC